MDKNIAIIPAKGTSKRLPRKNVIDFFGRPIIDYTIGAAQDSGLFDEIVVSSEDSEILDIAVGQGVRTRKRPRQLSEDHVSVVKVIRDVLKYMNQQDKTFDNICCLYPTAPLRNNLDIVNSWHRFTESNLDFCMAVTMFTEHPYFAMTIVDCRDGDYIKRRWPNLVKSDKWEKNRIIVDNGSIYWATVEAFNRRGELESSKMAYYLMPRERSVDIDTRMDYELALMYAGAQWNRN